MKTVAEALFAAENTRSRTAKVGALAAALKDVAAREPERLPFVARLMTGTLLPLDEERTLGVGGALAFEAACAVSGLAPAELGTLIRRSGDLGTAACDALARPSELDPKADALGLSLEGAEELTRTLVATSARAEKLDAIVRALGTCSPLEARYLIRALLGEMRVGAREGIVEDAIAKAFERPLADVRKAAGVIADVGELARLARDDRLEEARITVGRPLGFMLATPLEVARGANLSVPHTIEDKIDGIRAQAHVSPHGARLFARGKGSVTTAFPDVGGPLERAVSAGAISTAIFDGEIVVVADDGRPRPFSAIQPRLKKLSPDDALLRDYPARYLVYDLLFEDGESLLSLPFRERRARLESLSARAPGAFFVHASRTLVIGRGARGGPTETEPAPERHLRYASGSAPRQLSEKEPLLPAASGEASRETTRARRLDLGLDRTLDAEFADARARGFEGLVLKRLDAVYAAGVRGFAWLKVKRALATLDVVVVGAEYGHGKRAGVLSDYTFSVRDGASLKTIGKAYSGLTDAEIATMTERLLRLVVASHEGEATTDERRRRGYLPVRPEIVLEVAFDGLQRSDRHTSGFALRFPRIARIRDDKSPEDADSLDTVNELWSTQLASGHREDTTSAERAPTRRKGGRASGRRPDTRKKSKQLRLFDDD